MATQRDKYRFLLDNLWSAVDHMGMGHTSIVNEIISDMWDVVGDDAYKLSDSGKLSDYVINKGKSQ